MLEGHRGKVFRAEYSPAATVRKLAVIHKQLQVLDDAHTNRKTAG